MKKQTKELNTRIIKQVTIIASDGISSYTGIAPKQVTLTGINEGTER